MGDMLHTTFSKTFFEWPFYSFGLNPVSEGLIHVSIGSVNFLTPNMLQVFIWTDCESTSRRNMASYGHSGLMYPWFSMLLHYHVGMIGPMLVKYRAILKDIANSVQTKQRQDTAKSEQCARSLGCTVTEQGIDTSRLRQMAAILQTAFSNTFVWKLLLWFKFHWILIPSVQLAINHDWFMLWPGA